MQTVTGFESLGDGVLATHVATGSGARVVDADCLAGTIWVLYSLGMCMLR